MRAIVRIDYRLTLPESIVKEIIGDLDTSDDHGYDEALDRIEEAVRNDQPLYLEFADADPEIEADG